MELKKSDLVSGNPVGVWKSNLFRKDLINGHPLGNGKPVGIDQWESRGRLQIKYIFQWASGIFQKLLNESGRKFIFLDEFFMIYWKNQEGNLRNANILDLVSTRRVGPALERGPLSSSCEKNIILND